MNINHQSIFKIEDHHLTCLKEWVEHVDSLTDKLLAAKGSTQLEVMFQNWSSPSWWDRYVLQINDPQVFQREIIMKSHNIDYWFARTIIPQSCYEINPHFFKRLNNESIKNLIFGEPKVQRLKMITYPIDQQCIEYHWVKKHIKTIDGRFWVRLFQYSFQKTGLFYLIEVLLPELGALS